MTLPRIKIWGASQSKPCGDVKNAATAVPPSGWQSIETAPKDGTTIQARIPGHGDDNMIAWISDALENEHGPCGAWTFVLEEQEPPACWSEGWCWAVNADGGRSAWPTSWKPALQAHGDDQSASEGSDAAQVVDRGPGTPKTPSTKAQ